MKSLSAHIRQVAGNGRLEKIVVDHPRAAGEVYLHGAHVTHWQPAGHDAVLFVSDLSKYEDGRAIRGGIPICLPWFGPLAGHADAPAHGLVRSRQWSLAGVSEDEHGATVRLTIDSPANASPYWPHAFAAELVVTFGRSMNLALRVTNTGRQSMTFEEALHTYYRVDDARQCMVDGLHNVSYVSKVEGGVTKVQADPRITFGGEVDRVYAGTEMPCALHDPDLARTITVEKLGSRSTVVWNPAEKRAAQLTDLGSANWPKFVCIESANIGTDAVTLAPGASHELHVTVRLDGIAVL